MSLTRTTRRTGNPQSQARRIRHALNLDQATFARLVGATQRSVANWEAGREPHGLARQRLTELQRMYKRLAEVIDAGAIGKWFNTPNRSFGGLKPLEVIERGESDRIWKVIFELHAGSFT